jgi:DNA-binding transcriptional MerR regulator
MTRAAEELRPRYGTGDLARVAVILRAKDAGLSLESIRVLAPGADPAKRRNVLREEVTGLRRRIAAAQASLELLEGGLSCEYEDITQCPNFRRLVADRIPDAASGVRG